MIVALVVAVVVAVMAIAALVIQTRTLAASRAQLALTEGRADHAEGAARAAEARAEALDATQQAMTSTTEEQRQALAACEQQRAQVEGELERCAEDRIEAQAELRGARGFLEQAQSAAAAEAARSQELEAALRSADQLAAERADALHHAEEERVVLEHHLAELRSTPAPLPHAQAVAPGGEPPTAGTSVAEPSWRLLLARVERQWANAVGAGGDERGVAPGSLQEQLQQAVARDLERLREEVGLHTELTRTGAMEAVHPLLVLLAAGELAAVAASQSERVAVELGPRLVVAADGWSGDPAAGEALRATVTQTGLAGQVELGPDTVRIVLGPPEEAGAPA